MLSLWLWLVTSNCLPSRMEWRKHLPSRPDLFDLEGTGQTERGGVEDGAAPVASSVHEATETE